MPEVTLNVELRDNKGHSAGRALRRSGLVPGIFYARGEEAVTVSVNTRELQRLLNTEVNIIDVIFPDKKSRKSILREIQIDPVTDDLVHFDIMGINLKEKIRLKIPVILNGVPTGVKDQGGVLVHTIKDIEVEGLPLDIPEHIAIDITDLNIGDGITIGQISLDKVEFVADEHEVIANVIHPRVAEVAAEEVEAEEGEEGAEPTEDSENQDSAPAE
ncbi:50S ribosomal protein L25 [bacterium]|nr:50S ribosomal protein L25 [bacterium]